MGRALITRGDGKAVLVESRRCHRRLNRCLSPHRSSGYAAPTLS